MTPASKRKQAARRGLCLSAKDWRAQAIVGSRAIAAPHHLPVADTAASCGRCTAVRRGGLPASWAGGVLVYSSRPSAQTSTSFATQIPSLGACARSALTPAAP